MSRSSLGGTSSIDNVMALAIHSDEQVSSVFKALCQFLLETCEALLSSNFEHDLADAHVTIHELEAAGIKIELLVGTRRNE
eukprot:CAMPEP_0173121822 /NCGR_PEP_ID=MMETSP1102-20130122/53616_1 /TAXON_ID=49646 /ORGANISM="Geminigera sp., Strain Caron Lab Isolate" /LENGTH=80 /DNA_ID=CAMNT_0014028705 /DNA_START=33 /DNA_END=272 /DNA_ORIENTATION=+